MMLFEKRKILALQTAAVVLFMLLVIFAQSASAKTSTTGQGRLFLVSTGVGDSDNMTIRAHQIITAADIVFARKGAKERLPDLLGGKKIYDAGHGMFRAKSGNPEDGSADQETATRRIIREAVASGKTVAVLDNGDPTIYGPHIGYIKEFGDLNPEIIPGISSFNAANAALKQGIVEGGNRALILTAVTKLSNDKNTKTLTQLAETRSTMVFFMDRNLTEAVKQLKMHYPGNTPVAIVSEAGSQTKQSVVRGTLDTIEAQTGGGKLPFQHLIYVGNVLRTETGADVHEAKSDEASMAPASAKKGRLYLVSAGIGDPDNLTIRAHKILKQADIVFAMKGSLDPHAHLLEGKELHDAGHGLFGMEAPSNADRAKATIAPLPRKSSSAPEKRISTEEKAAAQVIVRKIIRDGIVAGKTIVVLDHGDPTIFSPQVGYMHEFADLSPEIVPGVSSFNAANAALQKGLAGGSNAVILTAAGGNRRGIKDHDDLIRLAANRATMVFFTMGMHLPDVIAKLKISYSGATPIAIVAHAGYREKQVIWKATLDTILEKTSGVKLPFEHLIYVGDFLK